MPEARAEPGERGAGAEAGEVGPDKGDEGAVACEGARAVLFGFVFGSVVEDGGGGVECVVQVMWEKGAGDRGVRRDGTGVECG